MAALPLRQTYKTFARNYFPSSASETGESFRGGDTLHRCSHISLTGSCGVVFCGGPQFIPQMPTSRDGLVTIVARCTHRECSGRGIAAVETIRDRNCKRWGSC